MTTVMEELGTRHSDQRLGWSSRGWEKPAKQEFMELLPGSGIKRSRVAIICIRFKRCNKCFSLLMPDCSQLQLKSPMDS